VKRTMMNRLVCWTVLGLLAVGAGQAPGDQTARKTTTSEIVRLGELPPDYAKIMSDDQKEKAQAIQAEFRSKIKVLEEQLKAIKVEQKAKIEALLTPNQKENLKKAAAEAKKARANSKPRLSEKEAIVLANAEAIRQGTHLNDYQAPTVSWEPFNRRWVLIYWGIQEDPNVFTDGHHFSVRVDDQSGECTLTGGM